MLGKTERTGKFVKISLVLMKSFLHCNMDRIYLKLEKKKPALMPGQLAFAEVFLKAQLVYIKNLQNLYNSQKYFKLNFLALYDVKNFAFIALSYLGYNI